MRLLDALRAIRIACVAQKGWASRVAVGHTEGGASMRVRAACLLVVEDVKDAVRREDNKFIVMLKSHRGDVCREPPHKEGSC